MLVWLGIFTTFDDMVTKIVVHNNSYSNDDGLEDHYYDNDLKDDDEKSWNNSPFDR